MHQENGVPGPRIQIIQEAFPVTEELSKSNILLLDEMKKNAKAERRRAKADAKNKEIGIHIFK